MEFLSPSPDTGLWVSSSGTPTLRPRSWRGWKTRPWSVRLFSAATCQTSMPGPLPAWISSQLGSRVSPTAQPGSRKATTTSERSGLSSSESSESVVPPWSFSRTSLSLFPEDTSVSAERNYAEWVIESKILSSSARRMLAHRTGGSASSSWPTMSVSQASGGNGWTRDRGQRGKERLTLAGRAQEWPTAQASDGHRGSDTMMRGNPTLKGATVKWRTPDAGTHATPTKCLLDGTARKNQQVRLADQIAKWPSPRAEDSESCGNHPGSGGDSLTGVTKNWDTPNAHDGRRPGSDATSTNGRNLGRETSQWQTPASDSFRSRGGDRKDEMGLDQQAKASARPTPAARDVKGFDPPGKKNARMPSSLYFHQDPETETSGQLSSTSPRGSRPRLNPAFVCWLMNWPWWWTHPDPISFAAQETASYRFRQAWLLRFLLGGLES